MAALLDIIRSFPFYSTVTNEQHETSQKQFHGKGQRKVISKRKQNFHKNNYPQYGNLLGTLNRRGCVSDKGHRFVFFKNLSKMAFFKTSSNRSLPTHTDEIYTLRRGAHSSAANTSQSSCSHRKPLYATRQHQ